MACVLFYAMHYTIKFGRCPTLNKIHHEDTKEHEGKRDFSREKAQEAQKGFYHEGHGGHEGKKAVRRFRRGRRWRFAGVAGATPWGSRRLWPLWCEHQPAKSALLRRLRRLAKRVGFTIYEVLFTICLGRARRFRRRGEW